MGYSGRRLLKESASDAGLSSFPEERFPTLVSAFPLGTSHDLKELPGSWGGLSLPTAMAGSSHDGEREVSFL